MKLHWPKTDQFINYNIFTLINSKGSLYQRKGSPSPSLLGHHRNCAGQEGAGQGRRVRNCQNTKSLHRACKGISRAHCSEYLASPQAGNAAFHGSCSRGRGWEGLALAMQGRVIRGNQAFNQIYRIFSTGYHAGRIGNALYSATETSI